jgi:ribulose-phosphate 3-epimerase
MIDKVKRLREMIERSGYPVRIEIDGGIDDSNIHQIVDAGAEIIVAGTAVFGGGDASAGVRKLIDAGTVWV